MADNRHEATLVAAFQQGSDKAFKVIFYEFYASLTLFATRQVKNIQVAQELASDALYELWKRHETFNAMEKIKIFVYKTIRNTCLNYLKHEKTERKRQKGLPPPPQDAFDLEAEIALCEAITQMHQGIHELPLQCQTVVRMSIFDGLKNPEIAEQLSISVHTVKNHKERAKMLLKLWLLGKRA